jgi:hypothetical protein
LVFSSWLRMATASSRFWTSTPLICSRPGDNQQECQGWSCGGTLAGLGQALQLWEGVNKQKMPKTRYPGLCQSTRVFWGEDEVATEGKETGELPANPMSTWEPLGAIKQRGDEILPGFQAWQVARHRARFSGRALGMGCGEGSGDCCCSLQVLT